MKIDLCNQKTIICIVTDNAAVANILEFFWWLLFQNALESCSHRDSSCFMLNLMWALKEKKKALGGSLKYIFSRVFKDSVFCQSPLANILDQEKCSISVLPQCAEILISFLFFHTISCIDKPSSLLIGNAKLVTNTSGYLTPHGRSGKPILPPNEAPSSRWSPLGSFGAGSLKASFL